MLGYLILAARRSTDHRKILAHTPLDDDPKALLVFLFNSTM
jgi:hypothetical protein